MPRKLTQEEVIEKFKTVHGDIYDYSLVEYIGIDNKVDIICKEHNIFKQTPYTHIKGGGCPDCGKIKSINNRTKTNEIFISDAINIHGNIYDYSLVDYIKGDIKVKIICREHGVFEQLPNDHIRWSGCPNCGIIRRSIKKTKTNEIFISDAINIHGDIYDYSSVNYITCTKEVDIICKEHGVFKQKPNKHLMGHGCQYCGGSLNKTQEEIIKKFKITHSDKYNYTCVNYLNINTDVDIICKEHGVFKQRPIVHINGSGCPNCYINRVTKTTDTFIQEAIHTHGDKYDYTQTKYINGVTNIKIFCKKHKKYFSQNPKSHINGSNCPKCLESKGENIISEILESNNINYTTQKTFKDCIDKRQLKFDFYIPDINTIIEYDGKQHFVSIPRYGGINGLKDRQRKDKIKNDYCKTNNIRLIRIPYTEFNNIEDILKDKILIYKTNEK